MFVNGPVRVIPTNSQTDDTCHHGIPLDIVSDRGPQLTSEVWKAFSPGSGRNSQPVFWKTSSDQRPDWMGQPGLHCILSQNVAQLSGSLHLTWIKCAHYSLLSLVAGMPPFMVSPDIGRVGESDNSCILCLSDPYCFAHNSTHQQALTPPQPPLILLPVSPDPPDLHDCIWLLPLTIDSAH